MAAGTVCRDHDLQCEDANGTLEALRLALEAAPSYEIPDNILSGAHKVRDDK